MPDKYKHDSLITAKQDRKYEFFGKNPTFKVPSSVILVFGQSTYGILDPERFKHEYFNNGLMYFIDPEVGILQSRDYGPEVHMSMEKLIEFGAKEFIIAGWAGTIQHDLHNGDIVICDKAIKDDGVSQHYIGPGKYVDADKTLVNELSAFAEKSKIPNRVGGTLTTCAPLTTTAEEVKLYSSEGIQTIEMEAATTFALSKKFGVRAGAVFVVSDSLAKLMWKPSAILPQDKISTVLHLVTKGEFVDRRMPPFGLENKL